MSALESYLPAFADDQLDKPFLTHYGINPDKSIATTTYTRGEFLVLAARSRSFLTSRGINRGDRVCHFFSGNTVEDLAFRLASVFVGSIPVTINWDADTPERILYKIQATDCKLVLRDATSNPSALSHLEKNLGSTSVRSIVDAAACLSTSMADDKAEDSGLMLALMMLGEGANSSKHHPLPTSSTRIIIFTSGTTGLPKGVRLSYDNYVTNQKTFANFLEVDNKPEIHLDLVVVNPMHHTNSTSFTDWCLRRPGTQLYLFEKYTSPYWNILSELGHAHLTHSTEHRLIAPAVSRHFDFLESLTESGKLQTTETWRKEGLHQVDFLIGSAPVGPSTVARLRRFTGKLPLVRFGSTETCLQVVGTPRRLSEEIRFSSFRAGWEHTNPNDKEEAQPGYYIGQDHPQNNEVRIVESTLIEDGESYLRERKEGVPGYLITRGGNVMSGYVDNEEATTRALVASEDGGMPWYLNLGDVGFWLENKEDENRKDLYWMSRESALLIRGGSNYAYIQIEQELKSFLVGLKMGLKSETTSVAVVGLKLQSEHEDACCVTIECDVEEESERNELGRIFLERACSSSGGVSKGAKPNNVRFGKIPKNFKGAILVPVLKREWTEEIERRKLSASSDADNVDEV